VFGIYFLNFGAYSETWHYIGFNVGIYGGICILGLNFFKIKRALPLLHFIEATKHSIFYMHAYGDARVATQIITKQVISKPN
jgi:hypothetical protein